MKTGVSKAELIKSLEATLKLTREKIACLDLRDENTVVIYFEGGYTRVINIACNSGIAIIRDVCKYI
ncbi:MAG TPA: hypothetical protein GX005_04500 [Bacteroidales bacterium]|nr:hypothetical protein [Bacteroidales bacterium]